MNAIARLDLSAGAVDRSWWPRLAEQLRCAWTGAGVSARDAIVLVPHAGVLGVARQAFAGLGGWQPRVETVATLAASLAPQPAAADGGPTGDRRVDRLAVAQLLRREALGRDWAARDPRAFDAAVSAIVDTALAMLGAAQAQPPAARDAWWRAARDALPGIGGPGQGERLLARWALEWATQDAREPTAALWSLRPSSWAAVLAGGSDPLTEPLLEAAAAAGIACWRIDADGSAAAPLDAVAVLDPPSLRRAHSLEDEAQAAALEVLRHLDAGTVPVALVAEDRLVVRRIRALLERSGVTLADETGWALSTTRAAGRLVAVLRAAVPGAGRDALLDALKAEAPDDERVQRLEAAWRREQAPDAQALAASHAARQRIGALAQPPRERSLGDWLHDLGRATPALLASLAADAAGRSVLAALGLDTSPRDPAWLAQCAAARMDLDGFTGWLSSTLEDASYVPLADAAPQLVITPLSRIALRPFAAVVFPGCDEAHLGAVAPRPGLLPEAALRPLGLPDATARRQRERQAFAQLLRLPQVTLLRRTQDGAEPLARSALVDLALHARRRLGHRVPEERDVELPTRHVARAPVLRPAPVMAAALRDKLSVSKIEALRECPYRFFAKVALGLGEPVELDLDPEKREQGRWLHAVLHAFHESRRGAPARERVADRERLREIAVRVLAEQAIDADAMLPFSAAFDRFAAQYVDWLHGREAEGWTYAAGEVARTIAPPELGGLRLEGRLDRIDRHRDGGVAVIDYKTGNADALRRKVREPLEDTQLACYAALLTEEPHEPPPQAVYLMLDDRKPPLEIAHEDPAHSASLLIEGLASDLAALRAGAPAPALGEEPTCGHCEMRGLCRRDQWSAG